MMGGLSLAVDFALKKLAEQKRKNATNYGLNGRTNSSDFGVSFFFFINNELGIKYFD